jgi:hypothetical protein
MSLDILSALAQIAPVLSNMAASTGKAQDTNAVIGNNAAESRPLVVSRNLSNSRLASMFDGYTKPHLKWGGSGSVAKGGAMPTMEGGFAPDSANTSALYKQVQQDALDQAKSNYGIKDPSQSSAATNALGAAGQITSILGALKGLGKGSGTAAAANGGPTSGSTVANSTPASGVPVGGAPGRSGMNSGIPGYFLNPDGTLVPIPGDPANGGGYGGGLFGSSGIPDVDNPDEAHD